jgi:hypothetical protein
METKEQKVSINLWLKEIKILETQEKYEDQIPFLEAIGKVYGYELDKELPDGDWMFKKGKTEVNVLFDSSRGGDIPVVVWQGKGKDHEKEHLMMNPVGVITILRQVIVWMKKYSKS